jgi:hypothetical protein
MKPRDAGCAELGRPTPPPAAKPARTAEPDPVPVEAGPAAVEAGPAAVEAGPAAVEAAPENELIMHLERDQFVAETSRPVARATLGRYAVPALWALRVFAVTVSAMVVYTFITQLN